MGSIKSYSALTVTCLAFDYLLYKPNIAVVAPWSCAAAYLLMTNAPSLWRLRVCGARHECPSFSITPIGPSTIPRLVHRCPTSARGRRCASNRRPWVICTRKSKSDGTIRRPLGIVNVGALFGIHSSETSGIKSWWSRAAGITPRCRTVRRSVIMSFWRLRFDPLTTSRFCTGTAHRASLYT